MLRSILIYLSQADWMKRLVMSVGLARRVAKRFVAGETLEEGIDAVAVINSRECTPQWINWGSIQKHLTKQDQTTERNPQDPGRDPPFRGEIRPIGQTDPDSAWAWMMPCVQRIWPRIISSAKEKGIFVRIDMEDFECLEPTLAIYWQMRNERQFDNVGMAIQSYLYRSEEDIADLLKADTTIRLVKGAYKEPTEVAYPQKKDVDAAFDRITMQLLDHAKGENSPAVSEDGRHPPVTALGTHDAARIEFGIRYAEENGIPKEKLEVQMLYGIRRDLQQELAEKGYPVRIYVPFGTEWYPYFMRRLAERPANLWFFISSLFRK